jgi:hypothetical protein
MVLPVFKPRYTNAFCLAWQSRNQTSEYFAQRRKGRKGKTVPNLAFLAPWREEYPNPRVFDCRKICPSRAKFELCNTRRRFDSSTYNGNGTEMNARWSPAGRPVASPSPPVGRNPEQEPPADAGAQVEG